MRKTQADNSLILCQEDNLKGFYGKYGGEFVPETLVPALEELEKIFFNIKDMKSSEKNLTIF